MCTVTFIPSEDGCFISSSRDEHHAREKAVPPALYEHNGINILYPKDAKANGSWIAVTQKGSAAVLLNGAFEKHIPAASYRKSRGLIFLEIISHTQPEFGFLGMNLDNIEPFTLILFVSGFLFECRWDGEKKHFAELDGNNSYSWSSATLYSPEMVNRRKQWFEQWLTETGSPTVESLFNFHRFAGEGDPVNSILMNRNDELLTVSITIIELNIDAATMHYADVKDNSMVSASLQFYPVNT